MLSLKYSLKLLKRLLLELINLKNFIPEFETKLIALFIQQS
jgi:hypothetical protein